MAPACLVERRELCVNIVGKACNKGGHIVNPYVYFFTMVGVFTLFVVVLVGGVMRMGR